MSRRTDALLLAGIVTVLAIFGVAGHSRLSGPVILHITKNHGVHRDDLIVLAAWVAALWYSRRLARL